VTEHECRWSVAEFVMIQPERLPDVRGTYVFDRSLSAFTWMRVGGPADVCFLPADLDDLVHFLRTYCSGRRVFPLGVGSNLIVRDGGLNDVVIRLGKGFNHIRVQGQTVVAGAGALTRRVAQEAALHGVDLAFFRTIPGTVGGALKMNAGCYGRYCSDVFQSATIVLRSGSVVTLDDRQLTFNYRQSSVPDEATIVEVTFRGEAAAPDCLRMRMEEQRMKRNATQPIQERSAGSIFRNPAGFSSTGRRDDIHDRKAWKLIDDAGLRGATRGGAQISPLHPNFLINTGTATAHDLECLGEDVRKKVCDVTGIMLEWEILRVGQN